MASFNKKLVINAADVLFSLVRKTESQTVLKEVSSYLMLAVYKMFRIVYSANPKNDRNFFTVPDIAASGSSSAAMALCEANAAAAAAGVPLNGGDTVKPSEDTLITANSLSEEFPGSASSLLNVIKNSEAKMRIISDTEKQ